MKFICLVFVILTLVMCSRSEKNNTKPHTSTVPKLPKPPVLPKIVQSKNSLWFKPVPRKLQAKLENIVNEFKSAKGEVDIQGIIKKYLPKFDMEAYFEPHQYKSKSIRVIEIKKTTLRGALFFLPKTGKSGESNYFSISIQFVKSKPRIVIDFFLYSYPEKLILSPYFKDTGAFIFVHREKDKKIFLLMVIGKKEIDGKILFIEKSTKDKQGNFEKNRANFLWIKSSSQNAIYVVTLSKSISVTDHLPGDSYINCSCNREIDIFKISPKKGKFEDLTFEETELILKNNPLFKHIPKYFEGSGSEKCKKFYKN
jgi:hypothetical protein